MHSSNANEKLLIISQCTAIPTSSTPTSGSNSLTSTTLDAGATSSPTSASTSTVPSGNQTMESIPEHTVITITCVSPTPTINIVDAYYGVKDFSMCSCASSNCTIMDVTEVLISYCANSNSSSICTFSDNNSLFGDTCPNTLKAFWLTYFCD
ncbi:unnamed protein product [Adineta steineri]|uniref:SUEL-type lectin domain-containing protein n=1 Tax=Adineta steineri TaxID=433720 RepID=A0A814X4X1_9BILA|nr:unnamed protein product [Adineta steineri]CAF1210205.1 unnamed protein product [Adineta steineri]